MNAITVTVEISTNGILLYLSDVLQCKMNSDVNPVRKIKTVLACESA